VITSAQPCSAAICSATTKVASVEPLSTITQRSGSSVWLARHLASLGSDSASSRTGVTTAYESGAWMAIAPPDAVELHADSRPKPCGCLALAVAPPIG
jgi:hypothetical protein